MKRNWTAFWEGSTCGIISGVAGVEYETLGDAKAQNPGADGYALIQIDNGVLSIVDQEKKETNGY